MPAEIGQLTSLRGLYLRGNLLMSVPAEIGQLTSLRGLYLRDNELTTLPSCDTRAQSGGLLSVTG